MIRVVEDEIMAGALFGTEYDSIDILAKTLLDYIYYEGYLVFEDMDDSPDNLVDWKQRFSRMDVYAHPDIRIIRKRRIDTINWLAPSGQWTKPF